MHTFHLISKQLLQIENHDKSETTEDQTNIFNNIYKINFFIFFQKEYSIQNKFILLNETIENIFYTQEIKANFLAYFIKIQKTYHAFSRLAFLHRYKKAKIMVNTDLIMNEIKENDKYIYCLLQNNCKYLFNIHELVKIIHNSIANSYHFFSNPMPIKNPYNNIVLNKSTLYNIYFFIQSKTMLHPELFYYFFKTNFDLNQFVKKYQYLLRNFSIKNYLTNSSKNSIYTSIECMIEDYNLDIKKRVNQIIIDKTFPKDLLLKIMKPYLELFVISQYSLLYTDRIQYKKLLKKKLCAFNKYNQLFGRKIYKKKTDFIDNTGDSNNPERFEYNIKHIPFNEIENREDKKGFMNNHASDLIEDYDPDDIVDYEHEHDQNHNHAHENSDDADDDDDDNDDDDDDNDDHDNVTIIENSITFEFNEILHRL